MTLSYFSFHGTRSKSVISKWVNKAHFLYNNDVDEYIRFLGTQKVDIIIGIGDYSGVDQKQLRLESHCNNSFRNSTIDGLSKVQLPLFVPQVFPSDFKVGKGMGNGFCNSSCYKLLQWIQATVQKPNSSLFTFPKNIPKLRR